MNPRYKNSWPYNWLHYKSLGVYFIVFYTVGITGLLIPASFSLFVKLVPLALVLSFLAVAAYHEPKRSLKALFVSLIIFAASFSIEAIGVNTGKIFGIYSYGNSLGPKLFETPLIIGLNWLLLVYLSASIFEKFKINNTFKILLASASMLFYDLILEQVAGKLDMWHWESSNVPVQNYIAWFLIAAVLHTFFRLSGLRADTRLAPVLFFCQLGFFVVLWLNYCVL